MAGIHPGLDMSITVQLSLQQLVLVAASLDIAAEVGQGYFAIADIEAIRNKLLHTLEILSMLDPEAKAGLEAHLKMVEEWNVRSERVEQQKRSEG